MMSLKCLQHLQVKDLIHYAVDSIGFATLLNAHEGHLVRLVTLMALAVSGIAISPRNPLRHCSVCMPTKSVQCVRAGLSMQEALTRLYVNIIVKSAILITISLLKLEREQLALVSDANVVGRTAKGSVDYLLKVGGLQVSCRGPSNIPQ